jgi:nicotinate phosphoribosyltransferase
LDSLYSQVSLALLTDLYEITMAYGYWKSGMKDVEAVFHLFFRKKPFNGGFTITSGLHGVIEFLKNYRFTPFDLEYLAGLNGVDNKPLFEKGFLDYLAGLKFTLDLDAVQEGEVVFPFEPLMRVKGSIIECQLLESPLLTLINFSTLISTKAARINLAAKGEPVIEFGLRRAQGIDGALTASRAAYIGGCSATSNVLAGAHYGIPVGGTMAHSWVMSFDSELESFKAYAKALPNNVIFLVDTYDTLEGVKNAIVVGKWLKENGHRLLAIRLDSGDLAYLSVQSRKLLDEAGFHDVQIMASNELEETIIADLKSQGAQIALWGVGTHLVTGYTQPALDGVYKLSAIRKEKGAWTYKIKLSEQMVKISNPGILQVRRFTHPEHGYVGDVIYDDEQTQVEEGCVMIDPFDKTRKKKLNHDLSSKDLLQPIFRKGKLVYQEPPLKDVRAYAQTELGKFDRSIKRFYNPHAYPVGLEQSLYELKIDLVEKIRQRKLKDESSPSS